MFYLLRHRTGANTIAEKRSRPKETWRRTVEQELKTRGLTLQTAPATAADRTKWSSLAVASSTGRRKEDWLIFRYNNSVFKIIYHPPYHSRNDLVACVLFSSFGSLHPFQHWRAPQHASGKPELSDNLLKNKIMIKLSSIWKPILLVYLL